MDAVKAAVIAHSTVRGGAEKYLRVLYDDPRYEAAVLGEQPDWPSGVALDLSPKWGGLRSLASGRLKLRAERRRLAHALHSRNFDFAHMQFKREQIGFTENVSRSMPVVWTEHGVMPSRTKLLLGRGYARAASHAALVICVSQEVAAEVRSLNPRVRVEVIENSVDTRRHSRATADERSDARSALGLDADEPVAIWLGRLDENKRPDLAAEVGYGWRGTILIAGEGDLKSSLVSRAGVRILGHVDPVPLYRAADALLMTSNGRGEGLPYVILEAAAYGLPAVVSDTVPLFRRLAKESGGVAIDETQIDAWRTGLDEVIGDGSRRPHARAWAEEHDDAVWRQHHYDVIRSIL